MFTPERNAKVKGEKERETLYKRELGVGAMPQIVLFSFTILSHSLPVEVLML